jgi:small ligand-binding sensory domain FIST
VALRPFHVDPRDLPGPDAGPGAWVNAIDVPCDARQEFLLLGDPRSPTDGLLAGLDYVYGAGTKVGGLASAPAENTLFLDDRRFDAGLVGVALSGPLRLDPVVSQGCRALGEPLVITRCRQNMLFELDGRRPTEILAEIYSTLDKHGRTLVERSLNLGIASSGLGEAEPEFLIRNVIGVDPLRGLMAVGSTLRQGQTVQFHVRDANAASEDLHATLERYQAQTPPAGALLFACAGRGVHLFGRPNHDSEAFAERVGPLPVGGMFCAGEIGPVGSDTRLLGYTSSFGIFRGTEV